MKKTEPTDAQDAGVEASEVSRKARLLRRVALRAGDLMLAIAVFALVGWFQAGDPECEYSSDLLSQLRMCDPLIVDDVPTPSFAYLAGIIAVFVLGVLLHRWGAKGSKPAPGKDGESHSAR